MRILRAPLTARVSSQSLNCEAAGELFWTPLETDIFARNDKGIATGSNAPLIAGAAFVLDSESLAEASFARCGRACPRLLGDSAAALAALRKRRLVGGDGLEPPTFCV